MHVTGRLEVRVGIVLALSIVLASLWICQPDQSVLVAFAQTPPEKAPAASTLTTSAELVQVPVVVRKGKEHVSGLTVADFTLLEGGRRQKLAFVKPTATGVVIKHVAADNVFTNQLDTAGEVPRLTVVVVDSANIPFADQAQVRDSFRKFLASDAANRGPTAVVSFQRSGVRVVQDFTSDPNELAAVMDSGVGSKKTSAAATDLSGPKATKQAGGSKQPILGILPRDVFDPIHGDTASDLEAKNFQLRDLVELELRGLEMLAQSLAGIPGRKTIIWLTGNFPFDLDNPNSYLSPTATNQYQIVRPAAGSGRDGIAATPKTPGFQVPATSLIGTSDLQILRPLYEQTMQSLARAGVAVYPVDTRGVIVYSPGAEIHSADLPTAEAQSSTAAFSDAAIRASMRTFASNTGGKACFGTNDVSDCLHQAISDSQSYYLLGYYRERQNNKPGWRKLKVEVDQPGAEVLAPDGYFYSTASPDTKEAQQRDIVSALMSPVNFSGLPFTVSLHPVAPSSKGALQDVKFDLRIPPVALTPDSTANNRMSFAIVCTAGAGKGAPVDKVAQNLEGTPKPETIERIRKEGFSYNNLLRLPSGQYVLHFVVRDNLSGKIGSVVVPYTVD